MKQMKALFALTLLGASLLVVVGCDAGDTNPVPPEKMNEIRKQEGNERANFHPNGGPPPSNN